MAKGASHAYGSGPPGGWTGRGTTITEPVPATLECGVLEIRLNRPEKNNALTPAMYDALRATKAFVRQSYLDIVRTIRDEGPGSASEPLQRDVRWRIIARRRPQVDA